MAPRASAAMLFHPKKNTNKDKDKATPSSSPRKPLARPRPSPAPPPAADDEDDEVRLPDGPFQEFRLMSSALNGWKYDVMKFDSRRPVEISTWQTPIKLNRKELRRDDVAGAGAPEAVGPMLGPDGKPVVGADGRVVMVDAEGRPIHPSDGTPAGDAKGKAAAAAAAANGRKKFQKKTRQVFKVPEEVRQLRREERYPWVMEDASQNEVWLGKLEEVSKSETHAFFMPAANDVFKFVPAHRWYKFQKKPNHYVPTLEEAEKVLDKLKKNKDPQVWLLRNRNGKGPSSATSAMFKAESEGRVITGGGSLVHNASQSLGPGGRRLKTVDSGMDTLFGDDDEGGDVKRKREKEYGGEGDLDEQLYEEDFADDEEKMDLDDKEDDETKELEERLKREYKNANKQREGYVDDSEDDEDDPQLTKDGKAMKKMIRNLEKNEAYDSDEDKNPYASSEEEEEEEPPAPAVEPAIQQQPQQVEPRSESQPPKPRPQNPVGESRANSPTPGLGGHSVVARRATSPKPPKPKTTSGSRGNSPLAGGATGPGSRATSPTASRAGSPVAQSPTNGAPRPNNKRKMTDDGPTSPNSNGVPPKPKKRKAHPGIAASAVPAGELEDKMVIEWLRTTPNASTRDCIQHFTPYLTDEAKKSKFTALVKEVAQLKGGVLVLRNAFRGGSAAPSPAATG